MSEPRTVHLWSLREDVAIERALDDEGLVLAGPWGRERITDAHPSLREALHRMELGPVLLSNVEPAPDGPASKACVYLVLLPALRRLSHLVVRTLGLVDLRGPLLSVCPVARTALFVLPRLPVTGLVRLPQDVSLVVEAKGFMLERVGSQHQVLLHRPEAVWVVAMLAWPVTCDAISRALPLPRPVTADILAYLSAAGMVVRAEENGVEGALG